MDDSDFTLRQLYALVAMHGFISSGECRDGSYAEAIAKDAFNYADAMLAFEEGERNAVEKSSGSEEAGAE
jgi:hypothetical protein